MTIPTASYVVHQKMFLFLSEEGTTEKGQGQRHIQEMRVLFRVHVHNDKKPEG